MCEKHQPPIKAAIIPPELLKAEENPNTDPRLRFGVIVYGVYEGVRVGVIKTH